jgi:hypothetical protein
MSVKVVDPAGKEMLREKVEPIRDGNLMDKLGRPDNSGWMRKKGEKYNTWKQRFFVLKGTYLYYLKSEQVSLPSDLQHIFFDRLTLPLSLRNNERKVLSISLDTELSATPIFTLENTDSKSFMIPNGLTTSLLPSKSPFERG